MDTFCTVRPEHLNHNGYLFGGQLLLWVDEFAWLAAAREFPGHSLVTRAMGCSDFSRRVLPGDTLRFNIMRSRMGKSSATYAVKIFAAHAKTADVESPVFSTTVTFVSVDPHGRKKPFALKVRQPSRSRTGRA